MIIVGIDAHSRSHAAVAIDEHGRLLEAIEVSAASGGLGQLCAWVAAVPQPRLIAIENARGYGLAIVRSLLTQGEELVDVPATLTCDGRRGSGQRGKHDQGRCARGRADRPARSGAAAPPRPDGAGRRVEAARRRPRPADRRGRSLAQPRTRCSESPPRATTRRRVRSTRRETSVERERSHGARASTIPSAAASPPRHSIV